MLAMTYMVRDMLTMIDQYANWASAGIGQFTTSKIDTSNSSIEQEVTIHAEFPNATNHIEIEEAFNNLINTASQYANRKS
jgi:hypothetical protein